MKGSPLRLRSAREARMLAVIVPVFCLGACADDAVSPDGSADPTTVSTPSTAVVAGVKMIASQGDAAKCVSVRGGNAVRGALTELAICDGRSTQQFAMQSNGEIRLAGTALCLDAFGGAGKDGDAIGLWDCKTYSNQRWSYNATPGTITGVRGKCIDATGGSFSAGTAIILWTCHGGPNQRWAFTPVSDNAPPADTTTPPTQPPPYTGPLTVFPGAAGFGTTTRAGRAGAVIRVTNLNDGGAGSLRAALTASGPRTVICEISGTVVLGSKIVINNPYLTFAGQTCPAPGLTLRRHGLSIRTSDVLIQHLRVRVGNESTAGNNDAIEVLPPGRNVVVDHVSTTWATDEDWSTYYNGVSDVTFSNSITAENVGSGAMLIGDQTRNISIIKMLIQSSKDRAPFLKGGTTTMFANNVVYNYLDYPATYMSDPDLLGPSQASVVGNYYKPGPNSNKTGRPIWIMANNRAGTKLYVTDNAQSTINGGFAPSDPWVLVGNPFGSTALTTSPPVWPSGFTPLPSSQVYNTVLTKSGMCPNWRDPVDQRIVANVQNGTGSVISSQTQVGGWPTLAVNTRALTTPANPNGDDDADGYTNLEEWLHGYYAACGGH